jgi:hypothetical protein
MEIIECSEPADECIEFRHSRLRSDDNVVPLLASTTLLLPPETVSDCPDAPVYVEIFPVGIVSKFDVLAGG